MPSSARPRSVIGDVGASLVGKKRALAVDPGLPIRPPNLGGTGRAVASSLLRSGGAVERGAGAPRPRRFQGNLYGFFELEFAIGDLWRLSTTACGDPPTLKAGTKVEAFNFQVTIRKHFSVTENSLTEFRPVWVQKNENQSPRRTPA